MGGGGKGGGRGESRPPAYYDRQWGRLFETLDKVVGPLQMACELVRQTFDRTESLAAQQAQMQKQQEEMREVLRQMQEQWLLPEPGMERPEEEEEAMRVKEEEDMKVNSEMVQQIQDLERQSELFQAEAAQREWEESCGNPECKWTR